MTASRPHGPATARSARTAGSFPPLEDTLARYLRHRALAYDAAAPSGEERRRGFRPWRYQQAGGWA